METKRVEDTAPLPPGEIGVRFVQAAALTTAICLIVGYVLLKTTGVPLTYPPLLPQQIIAGTVGGSLLLAVGYWLLSLVVRDQRRLLRIFLWAALILTIASFYLPYRLSYTHSLRFAGVTAAAQVGQGLLHVLVVGLGVTCFVRK